MLDFILGAGLAGLLVRGWIRGFVREVLDLVGLVLGVWVAFTLSEPLGNFLTDRFEVGSEVARIGSGVLLFVLLGVALSIGAHFLSQVMRLPGLNLLNRIGGSAVAGLWGVVIILVLANLAGVLPLPVGLSDQIEGSTVVDALAGEGSITQRGFETLGRDGIFGSLSTIRSLFGADRAVPQGREVLAVPPAPADEVRQVRDDVVLVTDRVNSARAAVEAGPLLPAQPIASVAEARAAVMFTTGRISRDTPEGGSVADDLTGAGILLETQGEVLALAATTRAAIDAVLADPEASNLLTSPSFDRVGVSVVEGPTGILLVIVLGG